METLKEAFAAKYPKSVSVLRFFEEANGVPFEWDAISKPRLQRMVDLMSERIAPNSVRQYCARLKAVLNLYSDDVKLPRGYDDILSLKKQVTQNVYLTDSEISAIMRYKPDSLNERIVKNQFLIGCLTCARHSDYINFTSNDIIDGRLVYVSKKTHVQAEIPSSPALFRILSECEQYGIVGISVAESTFNAILRKICRAVGITDKVRLYHAGAYDEAEKCEFVTSHTARRSAITNLYLRGADLYMISKLAGHSSVDQTTRYICCGLREIPSSVLEYFNAFN